MRPLMRALPLAPSRRRALSLPSRARRGFTIVEAIVAIIMLAMGVLAMVSSSTVVLRQMTVASQQGVAATVTAERMESLRSYDLCSQIVSGSGTNRGMTESWTVVALTGIGGQNAVNVDYTVTYQAGKITKSQQFVTNIACNAA